MKEREIKFRGISIKTNQFIYGSLLLINEEAYIYDRDYGDLNDTDFGFAFEQVKLETVGEFIGLRDKPGKEIYEGDVVLGYSYKEPFARKTKTTMKGIVVYSENDAKYYIKWKIASGYRTIPHISQVEIIGNVFENPELFGGKYYESIYKRISKF